MRRTQMLLAVLVALIAVSGCATSANVFGEPKNCRVYGGTQTDAALVGQSMNPDSEVATQPGVERPVVTWAACCGLADLPLSFVADTVTLPVTVPVAVARIRAEDRAKEQAAKAKEKSGPDDPAE